ncbi:MAG: hypothetical protein HY705_08330, partial [Gemmatimonadetes bacterium]|nr:hypothetical protein [Gemmatimonadota bacterium]
MNHAFAEARRPGIPVWAGAAGWGRRSVWAFFLLAACGSGRRPAAPAPELAADSLRALRAADSIAAARRDSAAALARRDSAAARAREDSLARIERE